MSSTSIAFTKRQVVISCMIKIIMVISSIVGIILTARPELNTELGCSVIFMYFTIQSNILISLICLIGLFMLIKNKNVTSTWFVFKFVGTIAITLTGFVFSFILAPAFGKGAWNVQNLLTHAIVPVMAIADFFVIIDEILAYIKKNHYLCSRFGCKDVTHACVRMSKLKNNMNWESL